MRFPFAKLYRAFPEFDAFPDPECERYIRYAYRQARFRISLIPAIVFFFALIISVTVTGFSLAMFIPRGLSLDNASTYFIYIGIYIAMFALPSIISLLTRDRILFAILRDRIQTARCPQCAFSLLGLPVTNATARCPECGLDIILKDHNLTPHDLMIRRAVGDDSPHPTPQS